MNCRSAEELFSSFLEEELSQKERRSLEGHLADCGRCASAVEELRATVDLLAALPSYDASPHFEEAVMDRIRSGEALRPTVIEWIQEALAPARLRPVFLAGATACAVWIAVMVARPAIGPSGPGPQLATKPPAAATPDAGAESTPVLDGGIAAGAGESGQPAPSGPAVAFGPRAAEAVPSETVAARASRAQVSGADSASASRYQDEYVVDQFYLDRSSEGGDEIVPVTGRPSDDVYITF